MCYVIPNSQETANNPNWTTSNFLVRPPAAAETTATDNNSAAVVLRPVRATVADNEEYHRCNMNMNRKVCRIDNNNRPSSPEDEEEEQEAEECDSPEDVYMEEEGE